MSFSLRSMFRCATAITSYDFDDFLAKIPGNSSMPYIVNKIANEPDPSEIPENEDLPQPVQDVIERIEAADSIGEKAAIAHSFSNAYINNEKQDASTERTVSFEELAKDPRGDCDDYAAFSAGLLMRGGVDPKDVYQVTASVNYKSDYHSETTAHALTIVSDGDDYYLLDNNATSIAIIDPANPTVNITVAHDDGSPEKYNDQPIEATMEIEYIAEAVDGRNVGYHHEENMDILTAAAKERNAEAEPEVAANQTSEQNVPVGMTM